MDTFADPGLSVGPKPPELEDQYESLLDQVWDSERRERIMDRVDAAIRLEEQRLKDAKRRKPKKRGNPDPTLEPPSP